MFSGVQSLRAGRSTFIRKNDPSKVIRRVGNPELDISDQSASTPGMVRILCPNRGARADGRREITARSCPEVRTVKGVEPSGVSRSSLGSRAAWCAGIGGALTPVSQDSAQGQINVGRVWTRLRQPHRKGCVCDGRIARN